MIDLSCGVTAFVEVGFLDWQFLGQVSVCNGSQADVSKRPKPVTRIVTSLPAPRACSKIKCARDRCVRDYCCSLLAYSAVCASEQTMFGVADILITYPSTGVFGLAHARDAKARASQGYNSGHLSAAEKAKVD